MPDTPAFYSINETTKPLAERVYHNNSACPPGRDILHDEHRLGTGDYRLCAVCDKRNKEGR